MLTKDLLRTRRHAAEGGPELRPVFLKAKGKHAEYASELVALFRSSLGLAQGELRAQGLDLAHAHGVEPIVARGLIKTCFDHGETTEKDDFDYPGARRAILLASAAALRAPPEGERLPGNAFDPTDVTGVEEDVAAFRARVVASVGTEEERLLAAGALYGDLPDESPLTEFGFEEGADLLLRYNVGLAQGLLVHARAVVLRLPAADRALARRLWKAFRFFGLVARKGREEGGVLTVEIEGPLSLHMHSLKYGYSLASFLPSLLAEDGWSLDARVQPTRGGEETRFLLEPQPELAWKKRAFHQYTPPELALVREAVALKAPARGFSLAECLDFLPLPGEAACFPDFELRDAGGRTAYVEIFHPWHKAALEARLAQVERAPTAPLVLAVSRKLFKGRAEEFLSTLPEAARERFVPYRETPSAGDIIDAAARILAR